MPGAKANGRGTHGVWLALGWVFYFKSLEKTWEAVGRTPCGLTYAFPTSWFEGDNSGLVALPGHRVPAWISDFVIRFFHFMSNIKFMAQISTLPIMMYLHDSTGVVTSHRSNTMEPRRPVCSWHFCPSPLLHWFLSLGPVRNMGSWLPSYGMFVGVLDL